MKIGIKQSYPRIKTQIKYYAQLVKPYTVFSAFIFVFVLGLVAHLPYYELIPLSLSVAISHGFGQAINQITDVEIDRVNKPYRPLVRGVISIENAQRFSLALLILSLGLVVWNLTYFAWVIVLNIFAFFYSEEPIRAKRHIWSIMWMAISRGIIPIVMIIGLSPLAIFTFLWVLAFQVTKDIGDEKGDALFGVKTIPNTLGKKWTLFYMYAMLTVYTFVVFYLHAFYLLPTIAIGIAIPITTKISSITDNNIGWNLYYAGLFLIVVLYALSFF